MYEATRDLEMRILRKMTNFQQGSRGGRGKPKDWRTTFIPEFCKVQIRGRGKSDDNRTTINKRLKTYFFLVYVGYCVLTFPVKEEKYISKKTWLSWKFFSPSTEKKTFHPHVITCNFCEEQTRCLVYLISSNNYERYLLFNMLMSLYSQLFHKLKCVVIIKTLHILKFCCLQ